MHTLRTSALFFALLSLLQLPAHAGAVSDRSLGRERSQVRSGMVNGLPSEVVSGGARRSNVLFHSLRSLSVDAGRGLYFQSPDGVNNILTRVTGREASHISGILGVLGGANLVLLNPNGIRFGRTATLDLRGSFLATTASSLDIGPFRFGSERPTSVPPLLTVDLPIGLNFDRAGRLIVQGAGHQIDFIGPAPVKIDNPITGAGQSPTGLRVSPGQTLALVGGDVKLNGGVLSAPSGSVELGAVRNGKAEVSSRPGGWNFDYSPTELGNISLDQLSLLDASGFGGGRLGLTGNAIALSDGSYGIIQNIGSAPSREIAVSANRLSIVGAAARPDRPFRVAESRSGFISNTFVANGADIQIDAKNLSLDYGGIVRALTYANGDGGNITVRSPSSIRLNRLSQLDPGTGVNVIQTFTAGSGNSGNITLEAGSLRLRQGSNINTATASPLTDAGRGGNIRVDAQNINVSGITSVFKFPSAISSSSVGMGNGGNVSIQARGNIAITNGGGLGTIAFGQGNAGDFHLRAGSVFITNENPLSPFSGLYASAVISNNQFEVPLELPSSPVGKAGNLSVDADSITLRNGGGISATNSGTQGNGGSVSINAGRIALENAGVITSATNGGQGGNIRLHVDGALALRDNAVIDANARRQSSGGNVEIQSGTVALQDNSRIRANAEDGRGGSVSIAAQGFFSSSDSAITANSERSASFDGSITVSAPDVRLRQGELKAEAQPPLPQISAVCESQSSEQSRLTISGTGGLPPSPFDSFNRTGGWVDPLSAQQPDAMTPPAPVSTPESLPVEAQGWQLNPDGTLRLVAVVPNSSLASSGSKGLNCSGSR